MDAGHSIIVLPHNSLLCYFLLDGEVIYGRVFITTKRLND